MSSIRANIAANYVGNAWAALMGFVFVPQYIAYLGMEAYGLIGVFTSLQAWAALVDLGLAPTLSREMARYGAGAHDDRAIRTLFHSMETVYAILALFIAGAISGASGWLAHRWFRPEQLSQDAVMRAVAIIGAVVALRWLSGLYRSAILGMQRQVWLNLSTAAFATLRGAGVLLALAFVAPSIEVFFVYQGVVAAAECVALALLVRRWLPPCADAPRFAWTALADAWRFAAGMTLITALSVTLVQADKVMLSRLLQLRDFGLYNLAATLAAALYVMVYPIGFAAGPRLTVLVTRSDTVALAREYHRFAQLLAMMLIPTACTLAIFAEHFLLLWTGDPGKAAATAPNATLLVLGTMMNGLMYLPFSLQLAHGRTRFTVVVNTVAIVVLLPALYLTVPRFGAVAAAAVWLILNTAYIVIAVPLMHRRLMPELARPWAVHDVGAPLLAALVASWAVFLCAPAAAHATRGSSFATLAIATLVVGASTALATPLGRELAVRAWRRAVGKS